MAGKNKEETKVSKVPKTINKTKPSPKGGIMGIALLLGVLSIGYSSAYIIMGTNGWVPVALLAPQMVLAGVIAAWKFCK